MGNESLIFGKNSLEEKTLCTRIDPKTGYFVVECSIGLPALVKGVDAVLAVSTPLNISAQVYLVQLPCQLLIMIEISVGFAKGPM